MPIEEIVGYDPPPPDPSEPPASASEDIDLHNIANLTKSDTGIDGIVYISTAHASHAARVKWYPGRPGRSAPCLSVTVEAQPRAIDNNLPAPLAESAAGPVVAWVAANCAGLLDFWTNGETWTRDEVNAFIDGLREVG